MSSISDTSPKNFPFWSLYWLVSCVESRSEINNFLLDHCVFYLRHISKILPFWSIYWLVSCVESRSEINEIFVHLRHLSSTRSCQMFDYYVAKRIRKGSREFSIATWVVLSQSGDQRSVFISLIIVHVVAFGAGEFKCLP